MLLDIKEDGLHVIADNMSASFPSHVINELTGGSTTQPNTYYLQAVLEYIQLLEEIGHTWLTLQELCRDDKANPWCCGGNCEMMPGFHAVLRAVNLYPHRDTVFPWRLALMVTDSCDV